MCRTSAPTRLPRPAVAVITRWSGLVRQGYFQRPEVRAEVYRAAEQSVRSPAYVPCRQTPADRNTFAFCFHLMHDYHAQLQQMSLIGDQVTTRPWNQIGKAGQIWERSRAIALAQIATNAPAR